MKGNLIEEEPNRDLESVLEFLDKVEDEPIKYLNNEKDLKDFRSNYGEVNFLLSLDYANKKEENMLLSCIKDLAKDKYLSQFYFGVIDKKIYKNIRKDISLENNEEDILTVIKKYFIFF